MKKKRKNNMLLNNEWYDLFMALPDEKAGQLIKAVFGYHMDKETEISDPLLSAMWKMMCAVIDENRESYEEVCRRNAEIARNRYKSNDSLPDVTTRNDSKRLETNIIKGNIIENNIKKNNKESKHIYGEYKHVLLTDTEHDRLIADYGAEKTEKAIKLLDEYIEEKGYKSKSHNLAMRRWVFNAVDDRENKEKPKQYGASGKFGNFPQRNDDEHKSLVAKVIAMR